MGPGPLDRLTDRERDVLSLMAQGHTNRAIADCLNVNQRTVETHVGSILPKLDLRVDFLTVRRRVRPEHA